MSERSRGCSGLQDGLVTSRKCGKRSRMGIADYRQSISMSDQISTVACDIHKNKTKDTKSRQQFHITGRIEMLRV